MFDENIYRDLANGEDRMKYLKKCIDEADKEKNYADGLKLLHEYIQESVFYGDCFKAIIMFPEYMALFNEHQGLHDKRDFMFAFKWILENTIEFHQISLESAEEYFEKFKEYCGLFGYSLRVYYLKRVILYSYFDPEKARKMQELFRGCDRDEISDCLACETSSDIRFELEFGDPGRAVVMLNEMLDKGISCSEVPETTYGYMTRYFTETGNYAEAEHYANMLLPMVNNNTKYLQEIAHIVLLKSMTDPMTAYKLINRHIGEFESIRNPLLKFWFSHAAARFFDAALNGGNEKLGMKLPHSIPFYSSEGVYDTVQLRDYFAGIADDIAAKMDERNGSSYFTDIRNYTYPDAPTVPIILPKHGSVPASSAFFGLPYEAPENVPAPLSIFETFSSIEGITDTNVSGDEENRIITMTGVCEDCGGDIVIRVTVVESAEYEKMNLLHEPFTVDGGTLSEVYPEMLLLNMTFNRNFEGKCLLVLMKLMEKLCGNAPFVADLNNSNLWSVDWMRSYTSRDMLVPERYMYSVHGAPSEVEPDTYDVYTVGLGTFGSREILIPGVQEGRTAFAVAVMHQYSRGIIGVSDLRDESIKVNMGIKYNDKTVLCSWVNYEDTFAPEAEEDVPNRFAVPVLFLPEDPDTPVYVQEITEDMFNDFDFLNSNYSRRIDEIAANRTFDVAEKVYFEGCEELIVGFDVETPEEYREELGDMVTVYAKPSVGGYVIDEASAEIPELAPGKTIQINRENVFFWRLCKNGDNYFPDEIYLFEK